MGRDTLLASASKCATQPDLQTLHKKWNFPLGIFSVNVTKSAGNCGFGHVYWGKLIFFVQWNFNSTCKYRRIWIKLSYFST